MSTWRARAPSPWSCSLQRRLTGPLAWASLPAGPQLSALPVSLTLCIGRSPAYLYGSHREPATSPNASPSGSHSRAGMSFPSIVLQPLPVTRKGRLGGGSGEDGWAGQREGLELGGRRVEEEEEGKEERKAGGRKAPGERRYHRWGWETNWESGECQSRRKRHGGRGGWGAEGRGAWRSLGERQAEREAGSRGWPPFICSLKLSSLSQLCGSGQSPHQVKAGELPGDGPSGWS